MIYHCPSCKLILPQELILNSRVCPTCGKTPALLFDKEDLLLSQGYRRYASAASETATGSASSGQTTNSIPISSAEHPHSTHPVEQPDPTPVSGIPEPPRSRGGNNRLRWMDEDWVNDPVDPDPGYTPEPEPNPDPEPVCPGPRNSRGSDLVPVRNSSIPEAPRTREQPDQPVTPGGPHIEGGPTSQRERRGIFKGVSANWLFILQLLLILAVAAVLGIIIYNIWLMRVQIVETLTIIFSIAAIIGGIVLFGAIFGRRGRW